MWDGWPLTLQINHATINRWEFRFLPIVEKVVHKYHCQVAGSGCMDDTYIKVAGAWKYLYRAVDKQGKTVYFLLMVKHEMYVHTKKLIEVAEKFTFLYCSPI